MQDGVCLPWCQGAFPMQAGEKLQPGASVCRLSPPASAPGLPSPLQLPPSARHLTMWLLCTSLACSVLMLETVNYIEHYGLQRRKGPDGRWAALLGRALACSCRACGWLCKQLLGVWLPPSLHSPALAIAAAAVGHHDHNAA